MPCYQHRTAQTKYQPSPLQLLPRLSPQAIHWRPHLQRYVNTLFLFLRSSVPEDGTDSWLMQALGAIPLLCKLRWADGSNIVSQLAALAAAGQLRSYVPLFVRDRLLVNPARIPPLDTSNLSSGIFGLARMPALSAANFASGHLSFHPSMHTMHMHACMMHTLMAGTRPFPRVP